MYQLTKDNTMQNFIVIASAFRSGNTDLDNGVRAAKAMQYLAGLQLPALPQAAIGSYKEEGADKPSLELSHVFPCSPALFQSVRELYFDNFEQDCILCINPNDYSAWLVFPDATMQDIGTFQVVSEEEARNSVAYTLWQDKYWVAK